MRIGGELLGLAQGRQVQWRLTGTGLESATPAVALSSNGSFSFLAVTPGINFGGEYAVTVSSQPSGQTCTLSNATGVGITAAVTQLRVSCMTNRHALGGTVTGLMVGSAGQPLVLRKA